MILQVLAVGDVVSQNGLTFLSRHLRRVKQEYGVELKEWSEIQNANCVIHAVAHGEFRDRGLEGVGSLMGTERSKKILLDIKGEWSVDALNKSGVIWWRM